MLTVIGLGNKLRGDDAIGPYVIEKLQEHEQVDELRLVDAGADAFTVLNHLVEDEHVLLIDSAQMQKKPGFVHKQRIDDKNIAWAEKNISLHGFGFAEILHMARTINPEAACTLIAVEPKKIIFNSGLSVEVKKSVPKVIKLVIEELE